MVSSVRGVNSLGERQSGNKKRERTTNITRSVRSDKIDIGEDVNLLVINVGHEKLGAACRRQPGVCLIGISLLMFGIVFL